MVCYKVLVAGYWLCDYCVLLLLLFLPLLSLFTARLVPCKDRTFHGLTVVCDLVAVGRQKNKKKLLKERIAEKDEKDKQLQQQQQAKKPVQW